MTLLLSPYAWAVVFLAIISVLYISSGFLTYYANKAKDTEAYHLLRQWFLIWALPMIIICQFVFLSLRQHNERHFTNAIENYWWLFALSMVFFIIAVVLIYLKKAHGFAFTMILFQFETASFGYALSNLPNILEQSINIDNAVVNKQL